MLSVFLEVVLPVAIVAILGAVVGRWQSVPVKPISALVFYLFSPALVFYSLATTQVDGDEAARILVAVVVLYVVMYVIATAWSTVFRHGRGLRAAFALSLVTANGGNMGLPVALLGFGQAGFDVAVVNFVAGAVLAYSAGIVIASLAGGGASRALQAPFRYPVVYAAVAGILVNVTDTNLPITIEAPIETLADAAVPAMLVVLGLQLQGAARLAELRDTIASTTAKLLVAPAIAWPVLTLVGLEGITRDTLVVLSAMPTAVIATVVATEFNARPDFVTRAVVLSTLLSMVTTTALITLVR